MLSLIKNTKKIFLTVHDGIFVTKDKGRELHYNLVSGSLTGIDLKEEKINREKVYRWHLTMEDAGEIYDLSFGRAASTFISVVRYLASDDGLRNLDDIQIRVYLSSKGYTNVTVMGGGHKLDWAIDVMPHARVIRRNGTEYIDDEEQMEWIESLVHRINSKLSSSRTAAKIELDGHNDAGAL